MKKLMKLTALVMAMLLVLTACATKTNETADIAAKDDIVGGKIGVQVDSAALEVVKADPIYDSIKDDLVEYKTYDEALMDLDIGRIDAVIIDKVAGMYKAAQKPDTYKFAEEDFGEDLYVIGFRKEDVTLRNKVQDALNKVVASGEAEEISVKWFEENIVVEGNPVEIGEDDGSWHTSRAKANWLLVWMQPSLPWASVMIRTRSLVSISTSPRKLLPVWAFRLNSSLSTGTPRSLSSTPARSTASGTA